MDRQIAMPVVGVDYPGTYQEFLSWFPNERSCVDFLERLRWPNGFVCPACAHDGFWRTGKGMLMCSGCGRKTSVTAGTIFHRSRTPLTTWFAAMWFLMSQKNGLSAQGLYRVLGFGSYETAWAWLHKLRRAMVRPDREMLTGLVELDETFVGGRTAGHYGMSTGKTPVMMAVERREGRRLGRIRMAVADGPGKTQLVDFACSVIAPGSTIRTDGAQLYRKLSTMGYQHEYVSMQTSPDPAHESLPGVHLVASLLKRWLAGTLHHATAGQQLPYYLDEFTFRFNRRRSARRGLLFYRLVQQAVATEPHPLADLRVATSQLHSSR